MRFLVRRRASTSPLYLLAALVTSLSGALSAGAADLAPGAAGPGVRDADDPRAALRRFTVATGLKVDLFAAEPDVRNPVSLAFDEQGRCFVVESLRRRSSVFDIRGHADWLDSDFSFRTVGERAEFLRREVVPGNRAVIARLTSAKRGGFEDFNHDGVLDWHDLEVESERIRLLADTDGDGLADRAAIFADGFNTIVSGVAAGVLVRHGEVYFTCIPDLWKLTQPELRATHRWPGWTEAGTAHPLAARQTLLSGFGVHIAFGGHDMHGLIFGPDGKLYWSIADRGTDTNLFARVVRRWPGLTPELLADSGCVFRCRPDGTEFEVVACGLRNPQELAFDELGNLFTADNNGDGGDKARWHYVVEGADFGWRMGWQWAEARAYQPKMGAWNGERLWQLGSTNTAAYLLRPLAHIGHGPAGLAYNPGTGLPSHFARHFFLCDFPGSVLMWTNFAAGASFRAGPIEPLLGEMGPSDVAFGVDGGVYLTDWLKSFDKPEKGRIYRVHDPATDRGPEVAETRRLLSEGMEGRSIEERMALLGHPDQRVRLEAQSALAARENLARLSRLVSSSTNRVARLHALWAIGQVVSGLSLPAAEIRGELKDAASWVGDSDEEVRGQAARLLTRVGLPGAPEKLLGLLRDPSPRARFHALLALWEWKGPAIPGLAGALRELAASCDPNEDYLRHGAVIVLAEWLGRNPGGLDECVRLFTQPEQRPAARLVLLLAARRAGVAAVLARFLEDPDPLLALEAARAIYENNLAPAMPALASRLAIALPPEKDVGSLRPSADELTGASAAELRFFTLRRALNANFRLGGADSARTLAEFAARTNAPEGLRVEALDRLAEWPKPLPRDPLLGLWRPLPARGPELAAHALRPLARDLLLAAPTPVQLAAVRAVAALELRDADLFAVLSDARQASEVRVAALQGIARMNDPRREQAIALAVVSPEEALRIAGRRLQDPAQRDGRAGRWTKVLESGSIAERQTALATLAEGDSAGDALLGQQMDRLLAGTLPKELELDLLEAVGKRKSQALQAQAAMYLAGLPKDSPLAPYRAVLYGGNAEEGRRTFIENQQVACFRCHKVHGEGGEVGPELAGLGQRQSREYILESILFPNRSIAPGFESVLVELKDGASYAGLVKSENATELVLNSPEDGLLTLKKVDIQNRQRGLSPMPEELVSALSRRELRDLLEFVATVK
jgi:quinoprotein glucose dehydrogenase